MTRGKQGTRGDHRTHLTALHPSSRCSWGVDATVPSFAHVPGKESQGPAWGSLARGAWRQLMAHAAVFHRGKGCSAQKGANKDSYSSPLIIWDLIFNICKYICVPVVPSPLSWHNS